MKLLMILSVAEYADEVRKLMVQNNVPVYSETEMHGFRTERHKPDIRSWFSQGSHGVFSTLFFSFQDEATVNRILEQVKAKNEACSGERENPFHAYVLGVETFV